MSANRLYERLLIGALGLGMAGGLAGCRDRSDNASSLEPRFIHDRDSLNFVMFQANGQQQYQEARRLENANEDFCDQAGLTCVYLQGDVTFANAEDALMQNVNQVLSNPGSNRAQRQARYNALFNLDRALHYELRRYAPFNPPSPGD